MNLLSWNCRGLGNLQAVWALHQLVKEKSPSIVFLMETLCSKNSMKRIRIRLGFDSLFVVDPLGRSGGLALLWSKAQLLDIYNYSRSHINAVVKDMDGNEQWRFTGFYGQPNSARREESWALLKHLRLFQPLPWLCAGNFNEIVEQKEKCGADIRHESQMVGFREALEIYGLGDLGYIGLCFTWSNRRSDASFTQERLDREMANRESCTLFPHVTVTVLAASSSDHNPLLVHFNEYQEER
jgi:hypothetical protein